MQNRILNSIFISALILISVGLRGQCYGVPEIPTKVCKRLAAHWKEGGFHLGNIDELQPQDSEVGQPIAFYAINKDHHQLGKVLFRRVESCKLGGCAKEQEIVQQVGHERFDYAIIFGVDMVIMEVVVYNYQSTYGQEICSRHWLKQFIGCGVVEDRHLHEMHIQASSGATISSRSITKDIAFVLKNMP